MTVSYKECRKCKEIKSIDIFSKDKNKKDELDCYCKDCRREINKKSSIKRFNKGALCSVCKEKPIKYSTGYCRNCLKNLSLFKNYNLTREQYNQLLLDQDYKCKICLIDLNSLDSRLIHVDHCHNSNKVRGILCQGCNVSIGHFKDNPVILLSAIEYLNGELDEETNMFFDREISCLIGVSSIQNRMHYH